MGSFALVSGAKPLEHAWESAAEASLHQCATHRGGTQGFERLSVVGSWESRARGHSWAAREGDARVAVSAVSASAPKEGQHRYVFLKP